MFYRRVGGEKKKPKIKGRILGFQVWKADGLPPGPEKEKQIPLFGGGGLTMR